ncbi:hypothetical protein KUTeg_003752 [Tegillarca granosa]|uniref:IkappaB kinase n=1 Tax=Tegillarca granosa TaxID=220873 RepID=A0ABQ9FPN1_TEGGR|nr:hypothetical protein KUTeg_003752 [Tegillarca granosa]
MEHHGMAELQQQNLHHRKGVWREEKTLGSGGFGTVVLWKNEENGEYLALKKCRVQNEMTAKHRSRWTLEVDIMKRLDHANVIRALDVPPELDVPEDQLPLLAMEYCAGGDLRKVLNKPENCCGIKEYDLRCLLKDIASAVEYLHGKRIIHRDLKPENIMIYKLIDLGYAKELDQGSAPELFASQKYTCTVDYWSFGTVVFECISGYRPFLPQTPPVQWHKEVSHKSPEDICAFYDTDGEVKFSKKLPPPNHLCRTMQSYFEQFLQLMLRWDNRSRGGGLIDNRAKCFSYLDNMLQLQCVHILHVTANQLLTYPLYNINTMLDLQRVIEAETRIKREEQDILLASGASPDPELSAKQCWASPGEEDWVVFLFKKGECTDQPKKFKPIPQRIQIIEQKKAWAEAVFFCAEQVLDFRRLILSQRAAMLSLLRTNSGFLKLKSKMKDRCNILDQQSTALQTKIVELQRSPFARTKQNETLEEIEIFKDHQPIVSVVAKCVMARDKSLTDLYIHLGKICSCKFELHQILPDIQECNREIEDASQQLIAAQKRRQSEIWNLLRIAIIV